MDGRPRPQPEKRSDGRKRMAMPPALQSPERHRPTPSSVTVRTASMTDMPFIEAMQRQCSNQIGHIPTADHVDHISRGHTLIAEIDGHAAAYLLGKLSLRWQPQLATVIQIAVNRGCRRTGLAALLVSHFAAIAQSHKRTGLQANCAASIPAHEFWRQIGWIAICRWMPPTARKREIVCWRLPLTKKIPLWFACPPMRAGFHGRRPDCRRNPRRSAHAGTRIP